MTEQEFLQFISKYYFIDVSDFSTETFESQTIMAGNGMHNFFLEENTISYHNLFGDYWTDNIKNVIFEHQLDKIIED